MTGKNPTIEPPMPIQPHTLHEPNMWIPEHHTPIFRFLQTIATKLEAHNHIGCFICTVALQFSYTGTKGDRPVSMFQCDNTAVHKAYMACQDWTGRT